MEKIINGQNVFRDRRTNEIYVTHYENEQLKEMEKTYDKMAADFEKQMSKQHDNNNGL